MTKPKPIDMSTLIAALDEATGPETESVVIMAKEPGGVKVRAFGCEFIEELPGVPTKVANDTFRNKLAAAMVGHTIVDITKVMVDALGAIMEQADPIHREALIEAAFAEVLRSSSRDH